MPVTSRDNSRNNGHSAHQPSELLQAPQPQPGSPFSLAGEQVERDAAQMQALVLRAIQGSMLAPDDGTQSAISFASSVQPGSGKFLGIFESAQARKHRRVIEHNRDVAEETLEAMGLTSIITTDFVAQSFDFEASVEQLIRQYAQSAMVMGSAPVYVQIARRLLMQYLPSISEAGISSIRREIERR
jgi:hypothetical protein